MSIETARARFKLAQLSWMAGTPGFATNEEYAWREQEADSTLDALILEVQLETQAAMPCSRPREDFDESGCEEVSWRKFDEYCPSCQARAKLAKAAAI